MTSTNNEHVFPKEGRWIVRRESSKRISKTFENKDDAMEYAGVIAFNDGGSVVLHKHNGQFKKFKHGSEIHVRRHKIAPINTGTNEIIHPILNNTEPIIQIVN